jgi:uncharacterized protein (TIGR02996 family)
VTDEEVFQRAIAENPGDDTIRLLFADWLEERGDRRAEFLRLDCTLEGMKPSEEYYAEMIRRWLDLRARLNPAWLASVGRRKPVKAILSDIHGNLEALEAVLADAARHGATEVYCLGDVVGYGPNPMECLELSMGWKVVLLGNFDWAAVSGDDLGGWGVRSAADSIFWFRRLLASRDGGEALGTFLAERPRTHEEKAVTFVHGTPRNPLNEYIFPEDIYNRRKMERIFASFPWCCFHGHTHVPGIVTDSLEYHSPADIGSRWHLGTCKMLCDVGSVGQPRDGDRRASYVLFDGQTIHFRRVEYDLEQTIQKVHAHPELDNILGDRLRDGR